MTRFLRLEIPTRAAALAYHTLLSLVPIVGLVFWYLMHVGVTEQWREQVKRFIISQLNLGASGPFLSYFDKLTTTVGGESWGYVGILLLFYSAWNLIDRFGASLDVILDCRPERMFSWKLILRRLLVMLALPITLVISLAITQWIQRDSWLKDLFHVYLVGPIIALPLAWFAGVAGCFLLYWLIPSRRTHWREALKAAAIVAPASEGLRFLFGIYSRHVVTQQKIYGIFAVVPLFILWVQLSWILLLAGALLIRPESSRAP